MTDEKTLKRRAYSKKYYKRNRRKIIEKQMEYYYRNRERICKELAEKRAQIPGYYKEQFRKYNNPEKEKIRKSRQRYGEFGEAHRLLVNLEGEI